MSSEWTLLDHDVDVKRAYYLAAIYHLPQLAVGAWVVGRHHGYAEIVRRPWLNAGGQIISIRSGVQVYIVHRTAEDDIILGGIPALRAGILEHPCRIEWRAKPKRCSINRILRN